MTFEKDCCKIGKVWVNKHSDIDVPEIDQQGNLTGEYCYVDLNFYACKFCGEVYCEVD